MWEEETERNSVEGRSPVWETSEVSSDRKRDGAYEYGVREVTLNGELGVKDLAHQVKVLRQDVERMNKALTRFEAEFRSELRHFEKVLEREFEENELEKLKDEFTCFRRDVEQSFSYLAGVLQQCQQVMNNLKLRMDRYVNLPPLRYLRKIRRRLLRL